MLAAFVPGELLIGFDATADTQLRANVRAQIAGEWVEFVSKANEKTSHNRVERITVGPHLSVEAAIQIARSQPGVAYAEPNWIYRASETSDDTHYVDGSLWGMYGDDLPGAVGSAGTTNPYGSQAEKAWANGFIGTNDVIIGVIDEGIQFTHPDLVDNMWTNPFDPLDGIDNDGNGYVDDTQGWDFFNNDRTVYDGIEDDHGTHVAGTIGAKGGNALGVAGVNWNVTMISSKFLGPGGGTTFAAIQALDYLTDLKARHGINIVATNNSWGGGEFSQGLLDAITRAANEGILFVASAGNFSWNNDTFAVYPSSYDTTAGAGYDAVISVAAITDTGALSSFSNYGDSTVDLGAPGTNVFSTVPDGYGYKSGTSMASPHVSGALALYASAVPGLTAEDLRMIVLGNVTATPALSGITVTGGRLDIDRMLNAPAGLPGIGVGNLAIVEGNNGSTIAQFEVLLNRTFNQVITVDFATSDGSATAGTDYLATNGTLNFAPGEITKIVQVEIIGDVSPEGHETFNLVLSNSVNAFVVDPTGRGQIYNDDAPSISINDVTVNEGNSGTRQAVFTVDLSAPSATTVSVSYATAHGTASASDYTFKSGQLTFNPGETSKTISITVLGDTVIEPNETFFVNLSNPVAGTLADAVGVGTIANDDVSMSIGNVTLAEGNSGSQIFGFVVSLSAATVSTVTVNYATSNSSATAGVDYTATSGTLTFAPGETAKTISVVVLGDTEYENNELFSVNLSGASVLVTDAIGTGNIVNDDIAVSIVSSKTWYEHVTIPATRSIDVNLSGPSTTTVTVDYQSSDDTATAGVDYEAVAGTLTFLPGETSKSIVFDIYEDELSEGIESFHVNLSNATNASLLNTLGNVSIQDNDPIHFYMQDATVTEGHSGTTLVNFTFTLNYVATHTVQFSYATANLSAQAGSDYVATSGTLSFAPGEMTKSFSVPVMGDMLTESNEQFNITLSNPVYCMIIDSLGRVTISDDDVFFSINDVLSVAEGNSGSTFANFTVSLSPSSPTGATVNYATSDASAIAGADYVASSGTLTFLPGETSKVITVEVLGDLLVEGGEQFRVNLSGATHAHIFDSLGVATIVDNDFTYNLMIADHSQNEGNTGESVASFNVTLSSPSPSTISVNYATADSTATAGSDYVATSGTLTFLPGEVQKTISVSILGDEAVETNESFSVTLSNPINGTILDGSAVGNIWNDDVLIWIDDRSVLEGNSGSASANFSVVIGQAWNVPISVNYATSDVTANAGSDYTPANGTLTFAPGETSKTISIPIIGDTSFEPNETFTLTLSNPVNVIISDGTAVGTIITDDIYEISVADATVSESNGSGVSLAFQVSLTSASSSPVTVNYATANGTATAGTDYTATSGTLTFSPGQTSIVVLVPVLGDTTSEPNETLTLNLSNASGATIVDSVAVGTIVNDDVAIGVHDVSVVESNSGTVDLVFHIYLTAPTSTRVTFNFSTANGTANAGSDYLSFSAPAWIDPGQLGLLVHVTVNGDLSFEPNETLTMNLSNVVGAAVADSVGVGTIINDDVAPTFSISDVARMENQGPMVFTVTLSAPQTITTKVKYATANGTAQGGNSGSADFNHANGTLTFSPGQTTKTVSVTLRNDSTVEANETFFVNLTQPTGATIADNQGVGTILNDDGASSLSSNLESGDNGLANSSFTTSSSAASTVLRSRHAHLVSDGSFVALNEDDGNPMNIGDNDPLEVVVLERAELSRFTLPLDDEWTGDWTKQRTA